MTTLLILGKNWNHLYIHHQDNEYINEIVQSSENATCINMEKSQKHNVERKSVCK